ETTAPCGEKPGRWPAGLSISPRVGISIRPGLERRSTRLAGQAVEEGLRQAAEPVGDYRRSDGPGDVGGVGDVAAGDGHGGRNGRRGGNDGPGLVPFGLSQRLAEQAAQLRPGGGVVEGEEDREGVDAFGQVLAGRLAEVVVAGDDIPDVVTELEHHPERVAEPGQRLDLVALGPAGQGAD